MTHLECVSEDIRSRESGKRLEAKIQFHRFDSLNTIFQIAHLTPKGSLIQSPPHSKHGRAPQPTTGQHLIAVTAVLINTAAAKCESFHDQWPIAPL